MSKPLKVFLVGAALGLLIAIAISAYWNTVMALPSVSTGAYSLVADVALLMWPSSIFLSPLLEFSFVAFLVSALLNSVAYGFIAVSFSKAVQNRSILALAWPVVFLAMGVFLINR